MGEEESSTNVRLSHIEANVIELKENDKEQAKEMVEIKLGNVEIKLISKENLKTNTTIKNSMIGFIIFSVFTWVVAVYTKFM